MLWLPVVTAVGMTGTMGVMIIISEGSLGVGFLIMMVLQIFFVSLFFSIFLYLLNLPVLFLAWRTECYRMRLQNMIYRDPLEGGSIFQT